MELKPSFVLSVTVFMFLVNIYIDLVNNGNMKLFPESRDFVAVSLELILICV